jgi:hypothetical protein
MLLVIVGVQAIFEESSSVEEAPDAAGDGLCEAEDVAVGGGGQGVKDGPSLPCAPDKHTVGHEGVEVDVQIQGGAEALNNGDGAAAGVREPDGAGVAAEEGEGGEEEGSEYGSAEVIVPGEAESQGDGQGEHPLSNGDAGKDALPPAKGGLGHATTTAPGADPPTLARQPHHTVQATPTAVRTNEARRQITAAGGVLQLTGHECREGAVSRGGAGENRLEVLREERGQEPIGGLMQQRIAVGGRGTGGHPPGPQASTVPT